MAILPWTHHERIERRAILFMLSSTDLHYVACSTTNKSVGLEDARCRWCSPVYNWPLVAFTWPLLGRPNLSMEDWQGHWHFGQWIRDFGHVCFLGNLWCGRLPSGPYAILQKSWVCRCPSYCRNCKCILGCCYHHMANPARCDLAKLICCCGLEELHR